MGVLEEWPYAIFDLIDMLSNPFDQNSMTSVAVWPLVSPFLKAMPAATSRDEGNRPPSCTSPAAFHGLQLLRAAVVDQERGRFAFPPRDGMVDRGAEISSAVK